LGSAKAWAQFNGSTSTISASYNVSSVTRNSTGVFTINFTNDLADANYAIAGTARGDATYGIAWLGLSYSNTVRTASAVQIVCAISYGSVIDSTDANVAIFSA
jgi:hypothetical protein